jgi:hypothetical protein
MNKKLKIALKNRNSNWGFALPIAVGMGLIMLLVAATLIMRSQGDQTTAFAQKSTAQGLSIGEVPVTRIQSVFKQVPGLASRRYNTTTSPAIDEWTSFFTSGPAAACSGSSPLPSVLGTSTNGWVFLAGYGHFKIIKYTPNTPSAGVGTLEVLGTTDNNTATLSSTNNPQGAISSLSVQIPYGTTPGAGTSPPGLWAATLGSVGGNNSIGSTNQQIDGNVLAQDCTITTSTFNEANNFPPGNPDGWTVSPAPFIPFPTLPALPSHVASRASVTTLGTANITLPLPDATGTSEPDPGTTDTYSYLVPSISVDSITITPGKKVRLYVQGNIELRGNAGISGETNALQIYGSNAAGISGSAVNYRLNSDTTGSYTTTEIDTRGGAFIHAFIFAPAAIVGVKGGGSGGGFYGSMWVRTWAGPPFGSSSNKIVINVPSSFDWSLLPSSLLTGGGLPGQSIQPLAGWQQKEAS